MKDFFTGKTLSEPININNAIKIVKDFKTSNYKYVWTREFALAKSLPFGYTGTQQYFVSETLLEKLGFVENLNDGVFYNDLNLGRKSPLSFIKWDGFKEKEFAGDSFKIKQKNIENGTDSLTNMITENKPYTFGIEIETSSGYVPVRILHKHNVKVVYDGSVSSGEYITGILYGDAGFAQLYSLLSELNKRCKINSNCGVHVHIGDGLDENYTDRKGSKPVLFNKEFTVFAYILGLKIQEELFKYLPPSRSSNSFCKKLTDKDFKWLKNSWNNKKEYIEKIEYYYTEIFESLLSSQSYLGAEINKKSRHPGGRYVTARYTWINFIGFNFQRSNTNDFTCEFRNHGASTNYNKIKNWILICMAIVYFIENKKKDILLNDKVTISEIILNAYSEKKSKLLLEYLELRKTKFFNKTTDGNEYSSDKEPKLFTKKKLKELL